LRKKRLEDGGGSMAEKVDEISIDWRDESGQLLVRQVRKEVLTSGAWSTILFMYQDLDKRTGEFGPKKIRVARYQKRGEKFILQSKFNISSAKQARRISEIIESWLPEMDENVNSAD
jgi:hypothetical protein